MRPRVKAKLAHHRAVLVEGMKPLPMFGALIENNVVTPAHLDQALPDDERMRLNTKLLDIIPSRGDAAFTVLGEGLEASLQGHLAYLLDPVGKEDPNEQKEEEDGKEKKSPKKRIGQLTRQISKMGSRTSMRPESREQLKTHKATLVEEMQPLPLFGLLIQNNILSRDMVDGLLTPDDQKKINGRLVDILPNRPDSAYKMFIYALRGNGQGRLADVLEGDIKPTTYRRESDTGVDKTPTKMSRDSLGAAKNAFESVYGSKENLVDDGSKKPAKPSPGWKNTADGGSHASSRSSSRSSSISKELDSTDGTGRNRSRRNSDDWAGILGKDKTGSVTKEKIASILKDKTDSVPEDKTGSTSKDTAAGSIPKNWPGSVTTDRAGSISKDRAGSTTKNRTGSVSKERTGSQSSEDSEPAAKRRLSEYSATPARQERDWQNVERDNEDLRRRKSSIDARQLTMIRTGMKVKQRQLIFANRPAIVDSIQLDPVLDHMVKEGEFTQSQVDELRKMPFRFSRNSRFVDILLTKGSHNYNAFCDALKDTGQLELARAMEPGRWTGQDYSPAKLPPKKEQPVDPTPKKKWRPSTVSDKSPGTKRRELKEKYGSAESIPDVKLEEMKRKAKERELKEKAIATEKEKEKEKKTMKDVGVGRTPELTRKSLSLPPVEKSVATEKENKEMRDIGVGKSPQLTRKGLAMYPDEDDIEVEEIKTKKVPKLARDVVEPMEVDGPEIKSKSKDVKTKSRIPERRSFVMKPASPPPEVAMKSPSPPPEVVLQPVVMTMPSPPPKIAKKTPSPTREVVMKTPSPPPKVEMKFPTPPPESELAFSPKMYGIEYDDTPKSVKKSPSKTFSKTPSPPPEVLLDEPKSPPRTPAVPTMEMEVEEEDEERPMTVGQLLDDRKRKAEEIRLKMQERKKSLKHEDELSTVKVATDLNSSSPETSSSSGSNSESGKSFERRLSEDTDEGVDVSTPQSPKRLPSAKIEEIGKLLGTSMRTKPPSPPTEERIPSPPPYRAPSPPMSPPKVRPVSPIMEAPSPPRIRTPSPPPRARTPSPPPKIRTPSPPPPARARTPSPPPTIRTPSPPPRARSPSPPPRARTPSPPPRARTPSPPPKIRTPSPCLPPPRSPSPPPVIKDTKLTNHIPSPTVDDDDIVYGEVYGVEYELVEEETPGEVHLVQSNQPPPSPPPLRKDDAFLVSSTPQKSSVVLESAPDLNSAPPKQKEDDYGVIFDYPELVTLRNVPSTRVPPPEKPVVIREAPPVVKSTPPTLNSAPPPSKIDCGVIADYPKLTVRNGHVNHAPPPPPSVTNSSKRSTPESYISEDFPAMMEPAEYNALVTGTPTPPEPSPVTALPTGQKKKLGVSQDVYKSLNSLSDLRKNNGKERRRRNTDSPPVISDQVYGRPIKVLPTTMDNITPEMEKQMKEAASRIAKSERLLQVMKQLSDRTLSHACQCEKLEDAGDKDLAELVQTGTTVRPGGDILIDKLSDELQDLYKQRPGVFNKKPGPWYANVNTAMRDTYNTLVVHLVHMKASLNDLSKAMEEYKKDNQLKNAYLSKRKEGHPHKH